MIFIFLAVVHERPTRQFFGALCPDEVERILDESMQSCKRVLNSEPTDTRAHTCTHVPVSAPSASRGQTPPPLPSSPLPSPPLRSTNTRSPTFVSWNNPAVCSILSPHHHHPPPFTSPSSPPPSSLTVPGTAQLPGVFRQSVGWSWRLGWRRLALAPTPTTGSGYGPCRVERVRAEQGREVGSRVQYICLNQRPAQPRPAPPRPALSGPAGASLRQHSCVSRRGGVAGGRQGRAGQVRTPPAAAGQQLPILRGAEGDRNR